jgi:hypothetical protein
LERMRSQTGGSVCSTLSTACSRRRVDRGTGTSQTVKLLIC